MKSIFILGASRLQIPAIKKAKEKGLYVYVLDFDPRAVGIPYADKFLEISTIDKEAVYQAALKFKPDYIITSTSDMPVRTVSWVCEKLGKKTDISYEGAIIATNKVAMRKRMQECGVPIPKFFEIKSLKDFLYVAEKMQQKLILKPADNAASRGVILIDKAKNPDLEQAYNYCISYSRSGDALVEEYMDGAEVSVEAFSVDGNPHIITITDKVVTSPPFFVELGHSEPSILSPELKKEISQVADAAIRAIGMENGPTHTEIKLTKDGAKLVEIAARLGGDFITSKLVPLSTGVDLIDCSFSVLLGENIKLNNTVNQGSAIRFIQGKKGIISSITGIEEVKNLPGVQEVELYVKQGDSVGNTENSSDRIGHIIAVGETADKAKKIADNALDKIKIEFESI